MSETLETEMQQQQVAKADNEETGEQKKLDKNDSQSMGTHQQQKQQQLAISDSENLQGEQLQQQDLVMDQAEGEQVVDQKSVRAADDGDNDNDNNNEYDNLNDSSSTDWQELLEAEQDTVTHVLELAPQRIVLDLKQRLQAALSQQIDASVEALLKQSTAIVIGDDENEAPNSLRDWLRQQLADKLQASIEIECEQLNERLLRNSLTVQPKAELPGFTSVRPRSQASWQRLCQSVSTLDSSCQRLVHLRGSLLAQRRLLRRELPLLRRLRDYAAAQVPQRLLPELQPLLHEADTVLNDCSNL